MKYYFIINPISGKINKQLLEKNIREACLKRQVPYKVMYTKKTGDAQYLAKKIPDEECVVFSVGGDGNLNEVLNGIAKSENKILGNIPTGSGNDFDKTLKQYQNGILNIDLGKINNRFFINVACLGLDADVANNISFIRKKKWIPVSQRYNASLVYSYFKYKFKDLKITMGETQVENSCTILAVGNGQYYGGGFRIAPHALLEDGMFDIYFVEKLPKPKIIPILIKLLRGKHENSEYVTRFSENKIIIDTDELCTFNVDGEKMTSNHFEIINIPGGIKVYNDRNFIDEILQEGREKIVYQINEYKREFLCQ